MSLAVESGGQWPDAVERILRGLPEWFGIEESLLGYVEAARSLPTVIARQDGDIVGVCVVRLHNPLAAENELTRAFFEAVGFIPLEERTDIWGPTTRASSR